jgi:hypothetical protein
MAIGHDGLLLVCGVGGSSSHYQIACHVHYLFIALHLQLEFTQLENFGVNSECLIAVID